MRTSYSKNDVIFLLKDLSGKMEALDTNTRERMIQSGVHYSEMLPLEYVPTDDYIKIYNDSLKEMSAKTAKGIAILSEMLYNKHSGKFVIISLARAGTPIGILVKRYIKLKYNVDVPHYSISIIRGKGIDVNAMNFIYNTHAIHTSDSYIGVEHFQFLDGWTGKGAINNQLKNAVNELKEQDKKWSNLSSDLAVLADPANICTTCGTHEDFLIPSACLNSTVSGLVSRTILRKDLIDTDNGDFHGAVYFEHMEKEDRSNKFIEIVTSELSKIIKDNTDINIDNNIDNSIPSGITVVKHIANKYGIDDINLIKPGVGETTRVLLRRIPWKVLINDSLEDKSGLDHILRLCKEKNIPVEKYYLGKYKTCGIIKDLSADA